MCEQGSSIFGARHNAPRLCGDTSFSREKEVSKKARQRASPLETRALPRLFAAGKGMKVRGAMRNPSLPRRGWLTHAVLSRGKRTISSGRKG